MTPLSRVPRLTSATLARAILAVLVLLELAILWLGPDARAAKNEIAAAIARGEAKPPWEAEVDLGIHLAAIVNLVLFAVLAATAGWWTRPFEVAFNPAPAPPAATLPRWRRLLQPAAMVVLFAAVYGISSFAAKGLWWDEMWAVKQCVNGTWKADKKNPGAEKFVPASWKRCAFYYQKPTNHAPSSLAQKASLGVWRAATGARAPAFSELALRVPSLLASGIAVLLLGRLLGAAKGFALGAVLLAMHPWHLRYGVEARAYAFIVPLCLGGILAASRVVATRARSPLAWLALGLNQALWIWTFPNAVLDVLVLFIVTGSLLWRAECGGRDRRTALWRLVATHVFAAALWLHLFLPNLLQARHWAGQEDQGHALDTTIALDTAANLTLGANWRGYPPDLPGVADVLGSGAAAALAMGMLLLLSLAGLVRTLKTQPGVGWPMAAPVIGAAIYLAAGKALGLYFYPRFVIALLPVFVAGLFLSGQILPARPTVRRAFPILLLALFALGTARQRWILRTHPYSGMKEASAFADAWKSGAGKRPLVLCYGLGREVIEVYHNEALPAANAADLAAARDRARAETRDLLVIQGYTGFNRARLADGMAMLDDAAQFQELGVWPGIEPDFAFRVLQARITP